MILRLALEAMGTRFELVLDGEDEFFLRAAGEAAMQEIREQHDRLSVFSPGSLLNRVNDRALDQAVAVDADLFELLELCRRIWRDSAGAFDPSLGRLMGDLGFRDARPASGADEPPPGFQAVELDAARGTVRFQHPAVTLDLGGVAKGWAIDRAAASLRGAGLRRALIHGGTSTAAAVGAPPDRTGWEIEIASHRDDAPSLMCTLADAALAVSSPRGRTVLRDGRTIGHVLDPRSGTPADRLLVAAVVCDSAAEADAWSTALVVSGVETATMPHDLNRAALPIEGPAWTIRPDANRVFTVRPADAQGESNP